MSTSRASMKKITQEHPTAPRKTPGAARPMGDPMLTPAPDGTVADAIASAARGMDTTQPLTFARHLGNDDAFVRGQDPHRVLFVVPGIWTGMPPALLATVRARRLASVTGRCPECSACLELATGTLAHEPRCPIADDQLRPALHAWGRQVGQYARGRRIREVPQ